MWYRRAHDLALFLRLQGGALLRIAVWSAVWGAAWGCRFEPAPPIRERCLDPPAALGPAVARVGAVAIGVDRVRERIESQGARAVHRYLQRDALRQYVEDQVRFELLAQAALDRGFARDPDVVDAARKVMVRKLLEKDLGASVVGDSVSDDAIESYYRRHLNYFMQPPMMRLAHVQLPATDEGRGLGKSLIAGLGKDPDRFAKEISVLAAKYSTAKTADGPGGALPFMTPEEMTRDFGFSFSEAVFSLVPGTVGKEPVQSTRGWHVVYVAARREGLARPLDEVRDVIRERLQKGQRSEDFKRYLDEIRLRFPVAIYDENLAVLRQKLMLGTNKNRP